MKWLRWELPERKVPRRPYLDSAVFYAVLGGCLIGVAALTGGNLVVATAVAAGFFVVATAYSWWRWREHAQKQERQ